MSKLKSIDYYRAELSKENAKPSLERAALAAHAPSSVPILPDVSAYIHNRMETEETKRALVEFDEWPLDSRARIGTEKFLQDHAAGICATWSDTIKTRSNQLPGILANYGKRFEALKAAFESGDTREANRKKRDAIEEEVETLEESIQTAKTAVRSFELMPTLEAFESADALVNKITLPNS